MASGAPRLIPITVSNIVTYNLRPSGLNQIPDAVLSYLSVLNALDNDTVDRSQGMLRSNCLIAWFVVNQSLRPLAEKYKSV